MVIMIDASWNIRGLNKTGRMKCIADFIRMNNLDFVGFQETKKKEVFCDNFLISAGKDFTWNFIPVRGTTGGILVGFKDSSFEIVIWKYLEYSAIATVKNNVDNFIWRLIVVYGSPYDETKMEFIDEIHKVMSDWQGPTVIGGDFNLVKEEIEKSNGVINYEHAFSFCDWINKWGLIELKDPSRNNQECPIMATLDRILVSIEWDSKYPLAKVQMLPKGVSDHNPLLINFGGRIMVKDPLFRFEKWWLE